MYFSVGSKTRLFACFDSFPESRATQSCLHEHKLSSTTFPGCSSPGDVDVTITSTSSSYLAMSDELVNSQYSSLRSYNGGGGGGGPPATAVGACLRRFFARITLQKPYEVIVAEDISDKLERVLGLWDLLAIGIGGTLGTGVFVLTGQVARLDAGPAVVLSWLVGGVACMLSGLSFAEMAVRVPLSGSSYSYAYHVLGELPGVIAGWMVALEYGISGAAVARSWGDKVKEYLSKTLDVEDKYIGWMTPHDFKNSFFGEINIAAGFIMIASVGMLLLGLGHGRVTINIFTVAKCTLVAFMTITAFTAWHGTNLTPFVPDRVLVLNPETDKIQGAYGLQGIITGATHSFFGYIGFDEVCCMAAEVKNPGKIMHKAVIGTIVGIAGISALASLSLVAMTDYSKINTKTGFSSGFGAIHYPAAEQITAVGEIVTLPLVVLISVLAQPRLQFAMAEDGMLPKFFSATNKNGVLVKGTIAMGALMTLVSVFVEFSSINDMISAGVLLAFNFTNMSVIVVNTRSERPALSQSLTWLYFFAAMFTAFLWTHFQTYDSDERPTSVWFFTIAASVVSFVTFVTLQFSCPRGERAGESPPVFRAPLGRFVLWFACCCLFVQSCMSLLSISTCLALAFAFATKHSLFIPFFPPSINLVPLIPALAIMVNWYLIAALDWAAIYRLLIYLGLALLSYVCYGYWKSTGNNTGWAELLRRSTVKATATDGWQ
jgi:amino acid transporter